MKSMLVALADLDWRWQLVHEFTSEQIEVLSENLFSVNIQQFVLLNDKQVF